MGDPLKRLRQLQARAATLPTDRDELVSRIQAMLTEENERVNTLGGEAEEALQLADQISTSIQKARRAIEDTRRVWSEVK